MLWHEAWTYPQMQDFPLYLFMPENMEGYMKSMKIA
jgi:hypothetical protein